MKRDATALPVEAVSMRFLLVARDQLPERKAR
jgi:hypothetical protein